MPGGPRLGDVFSGRRGRASAQGAFSENARLARDSLEEERHLDPQRFRDLEQVAGADAVGAALVFLDLLTPIDWPNFVWLMRSRRAGRGYACRQC